jgi:formylglycine-generating enzyme required for sulfatase activity
LVAARLIAVNNQEVEVAHEALIRRWPRLQGWLDTNRERLRFERQLARDAELWQETMNRDPGTLYRGARLAQALEWQARDDVSLEPLSAEFLAESHRQTEQEAYEKEALYKRQLLLARSLASAAVVVLLLVAGIAAFPTLQNWYYQQQAIAPLVLVEAGDHPFFLEAHEVSNRQYKRCVAAGACSLPHDVTKGYFEPGSEDLPVETVSGYQANEYCQWLDRRLPTLAEWHIAYENAHLMPQPAHLGLEADILPQEVWLPTNEKETIYHLVGNVWEWTASFDNLDLSSDIEKFTWDGALEGLCTSSIKTPDCKEPILQIVGGGIAFTDSANDPRENLLTLSLFNSYSYIGFRCAQDK